MSKPLKTYRFKGVQLSDWGQGKYSIDKRYKKKDSDEWLSTKTFFTAELEGLRDLLNEALTDGKTVDPNLLDSLPKAESNTIPFDDDELPF